MRIQKFLSVLMVVSTILLSSCARMQPPKPTFFFETKTPAERQAQLKTVRFWETTGALSIQREGEKPAIVTYDWHQFSRKGYRIKMVSALGLYRIQIMYQMHSVTFWKNGMHVSTARTPEGLMQETMGWSLPISNMYDWIKGMPAPDKNCNYFAQYDAFGHLILLEQNGWTIKYAGYRTVSDANRVDLPQIVTMTRPGMTVKIVIKEWQLFAYHHQVHEMMID